MDRVRSLDRALDLLELLAAEPQIGVMEAAARAGLVASTAHRLLATLVQRGYAAQDPVTGRYALGFKVMQLAEALDTRTAGLREAAHPELESVQQATGETTNLVVLNSDRVVYVDQVEGTHSVRMFTELGSSAQAHTTAAGKAILACLPRRAVRTIYPPEREPLQRLTPNTLTTVAALEEDFARVRARGYATDQEEHELGVSCVATAIVDPDGAPVAALSVSGPSARLKDRAALAALLRRHAAAVSAALARTTPARRSSDSA